MTALELRGVSWSFIIVCRRLGGEQNVLVWLQKMKESEMTLSEQKIGQQLAFVSGHKNLVHAIRSAKDITV